MTSVRYLIPVILILASVPLRAQTDVPMELSCSHPDVVRAQVRSVTQGNPSSVTTTPVKANGEHVAGLKPEDFRITKGRKIAEILAVDEITSVENTVMRVVFMVDNSQSMSPWLDILRSTLERTVGGFSDAVRVSVMFFREGELAAPPFEYNGKPLPLIRLPYTYDKARAVDYTRKLLVERNLTRNTYLYDGVYATTQQIRADTGTVDRSFAIIFSDGEDNASEVAAATALREEKLGTVFYTIDYLTKANTFLVDLAARTGGEHFLARNAEDLGGIFEAIASKIVARGYTVTYRFKPPPTASLEASVDELVMEEDIVRETFPVLPYVFFEQESAILPQRYERLAPTERAAFDETAIEGGAMDFYYNVLNILGSRMQQMPETRITVTGYVNGVGGEKGDAALAADRARVVQDYLQTAWGIDAGRITAAAGEGLPPVPSTSRDTLGQAENRRVEIRSDSWELLRPVTFVRRVVALSPPDVVFATAVDAPEGLAHWILSVEQNGDEFDRREGAQHEPRIRWNWKNRQGAMPASSGPLQCRYLVEDQAGDSFLTDPVQIGVREVRHERRQNVSVTDDGITIEKISLILFPFDVAEPGEQNQRIMEEFVYPRVTPGSRITVNGYTDVIGSEEYNEELSRKRADAVAEILAAAMGEGSRERIESVGRGETEPVFSNELPEKRFYNRTVSLLIERYPDLSR